jgi:DNA-binding SARP family transcriptional activator
MNGFRLQCGGRIVRIPVTTQRVLAFLAIHEGDLLRSHVANVLWPDTTEERAAANLRSALWKLGTDRLEVTESTARILALSSSVVVDAREMERSARRILSSTFDETLEGELLTRSGELLPGFYDDWLVAERERLHQLRLHALEALCERWTASGHYSQAVAAGLAAVAGEPLRESAQAILIKAFLAEGNPAEAIRQFQRYRHSLRIELDLDPSQELRSELARWTEAIQGPVSKLAHRQNRRVPGAAFTLLALAVGSVTYAQYMF